MPNVEHNSLTGAENHEPKGAETATAGQIYIADGAGSGDWTTPSLGSIDVAVPASAGATGTAGQIAYASGFLYICVATNTWQRVAIATWP